MYSQRICKDNIILGNYNMRTVLAVVGASETQRSGVKFLFQRATKFLYEIYLVFSSVKRFRYFSTIKQFTGRDR